jgi:pantoate--beta-alanine ligase
MEVIETVANMHKKVNSLRTTGKTISFVPTMGFLHDGHVELMKIGKKIADILILSIFVNPTQFGPNEDFDQYPRDMDGDLAKANKAGVDIVYTPAVDEMYPEGYQTKVTVGEITKFLCGASRPGHFEGVTTVVNKLFNIVKPNFAVFGQKDFQQLAVIRRMVIDLNMDIKIVGAPIVRESDGLAMSSRNKYLSPEQRESALCLKKSIDLASKMVQEGERSSEKILNSVKKFIQGHPFTDIDYVNICDPETLEDIDMIEEDVLLALAVKVGTTRLIDNSVLSS